MGSMIGPLSVALLASALLTALLAAYAWNRRSGSPAIPYAAIFFVAVTIYGGGYAMELASVSLEEILFWVRVEYLGIVIIPTVVVAMAFAYTGRERLLTPPAIAGLMILPAITFTLVLFLNPLYYAAIGLDLSGPLPRFAYEPGPWFVVHAIYTLVVLIVAVALLALYLRSAHPPFRNQIMVVLAGAMIPIAAYVCYLAGLSPVPGLDLTPIALPFTAVAFMIGIVSYQLFDLAPVARSVVFDRIPVGVLVVDAPGRVVEANPSAAELLGSGGEPLVGRTLEEITSLLPPLDTMLAHEGDAEIEIQDPVRNRTLAVSAAPLRTGSDDRTGTVVLVSDITPRRRAEGALARRTADLEAANRRLSLVSTFTRHDLANHLVVIEGYLSLLREDPENPAAPELLDRLSGAVERVRVLLGFIRDYPAIGVQPPVWLDLGATAERAAHGVGLGDVAVDNRIPSLSVLADPLLERVFVALIENAVRHGGGTTRLVFGAVPGGDGLVLVVEDDGVGIPWPDKERIFERGFGRNTGLGLFLAREILESMGMTITETGVPGHGARFEVRIPAGRVRHRAGNSSEVGVTTLALKGR